MVCDTQDFWFSRGIQNILKTQYKCRLHLAKYSSCNIHFNHNINVIPITGLYDMVTVMMLGVPSRREGISGLKPAQACCSHQNLFASYIVFILHVGLSRVFNPPLLVWLTQGDNFPYQVIHSTVDSCSSKTKATLWSPLCWDQLLCIILWASWAHHPCPFPLSFLLL